MSNKVTTESFIQHAIEKHGDKFDYSLSEYVSAKIKIKIICKKHGLFETTSGTHLHKTGGCIKCQHEKLSESNRSNTEEFIKRSKEVHGDQYDYSKTIYKRKSEKVLIICREHGEFYQRPDVHYNGAGCLLCGRKRHSDNIRFNTEDFIRISNKKHNNFYDYSKVEYNDSREDVLIICPVHGEFKQRASHHMSGSGCLQCNWDAVGERFAIGSEEFLKRANQIHNNKYQYDLSTYQSLAFKMKIICSEHGIFEQQCAAHLRGNGCPTCSMINNAEKQMISIEEFLEKSKEIHNDKYDYSLIIKREIYSDKAHIICPIHGEFKQRFTAHIHGSGCPKCKTSKGELKILKELERLNIDYDYQYVFDDCLSTKNKPLIFDFYLPDLNMCIEYDGKQHYKPIKHFGGEKAFKRRQEYDRIKNEYCRVNNIQLLRIRYDEFNEIENILNKYLRMS